MRVLSLFSGGGLGDYGLELAGMEIVGQVEIDDYCQRILKLRWPEVPKWGDIREVRGEEVLAKIGRVDLISGGFPCQDISVANTSGKGIAGERSGLWKEYLRLICEIRPRFVLVENVTALLGRGLGVVLGDLAKAGYDSEWFCLSAAEIGANHKRDRVWIFAYPVSNGLSEGNKNRCGASNSRPHSQDNWKQESNTSDIGQVGNDVADTQSIHAQGLMPRPGKRQFRRSSWWQVEPNVGRVAHGVANRVDRLKLLGNGQVVQVVQWIGERIMEHEHINRVAD